MPQGGARFSVSRSIPTSTTRGRWCRTRRGRCCITFLEGHGPHGADPAEPQVAPRARRARSDSRHVTRTTHCCLDSEEMTPTHRTSGGSDYLQRKTGTQYSIPARASSSLGIRTAPPICPAHAQPGAKHGRPSQHPAYKGSRKTSLVRGRKPACRDLHEASLARSGSAALWSALPLLDPILTLDGVCYTPEQSQRATYNNPAISRIARTAQGWSARRPGRYVGGWSTS